MIYPQKYKKHITCPSTVLWWTWNSVNQSYQFSNSKGENYLSLTILDFFTKYATKYKRNCRPKEENTHNGSIVNLWNSTVLLNYIQVQLGLNCTSVVFTECVNEEWSPLSGFVLHTLQYLLCSMLYFYLKISMSLRPTDLSSPYLFGPTNTTDSRYYALPF